MTTGALWEPGDLVYAQSGGRVHLVGNRPVWLPRDGARVEVPQTICSRTVEPPAWQGNDHFARDLLAAGDLCQICKHSAPGEGVPIPDPDDLDRRHHAPTRADRPGAAAGADPNRPGAAMARPDPTHRTPPPADPPR